MWKKSIQELFMTNISLLHRSWTFPYHCFFLYRSPVILKSWFDSYVQIKMLWLLLLSLTLIQHSYSSGRCMNESAVWWHTLQRVCWPLLATERATIIFFFFFYFFGGVGGYSCVQSEKKNHNLTFLSTRGKKLYQYKLILQFKIGYSIYFFIYFGVWGRMFLFLKDKNL